MNKPPTTQNPSKNFEKRASLPYVHGLSQPVQRIFAKHSVSLSFKPNITIKDRVTKLKDKIPKKKKSNLVYEISCSEPNCTAKYIVPDFVVTPDFVVVPENR